jgi:hypothetical protein
MAMVLSHLYLPFLYHITNSLVCLGMDMEKATSLIMTMTISGTLGLQDSQWLSGRRHRSYRQRWKCSLSAAHPTGRRRLYCRRPSNLLHDVSWFKTSKINLAIKGAYLYGSNTKNKKHVRQKFYLTAIFFTSRASFQKRCQQIIHTHIVVAITNPHLLIQSFKLSLCRHFGFFFVCHGGAFGGG